MKLDWNNIKIIDPCAGGNREVKDSGGIREIYHPMSYQTAIHNIFLVVVMYITLIFEKIL